MYLQPLGILDLVYLGLVYQHKEDVWDKIFASMGQSNAKWATGDIKRALVEEMVESDSET